MRRKNLLIPILVFIFSFVVLSFYQKFQRPGTLANTTELPPVLWSKASADISKVVYSIKDKQITAERKDNEWYLSSLDNKKADSLYIYTTISAFLEPKFTELIASSPKDLSIYGIDDASCKLSLYDTAGTEYTIIQGSAIDAALTYVYVPVSKTVYSMDSSLFNNLSINQDDWLNKQLMNFKVEDVTQITFSYKGFETTLVPEMTEDGITFSGTNINSSLSEKFVCFLQNSKIEQFITSSATDHVLLVYGFTNPNLKCSVSLKSGETLSLIIGGIKEDENICYAMVNHNNAIVAIPYFDFSQFDSLFAQLEASDSLTLG